MPTAPTYPGVYLEEISSPVRAITGVATSITAFLGRAARGPVNTATTILSFADYDQIFGGLDINSEMSFAVQDFFSNGGSRAVIVRLFQPVEKSKAIAAGLAVLEAINDNAKLREASDQATAKQQEFHDLKNHSVEELRATTQLLERLNETLTEWQAKESDEAVQQKTGADLKAAVDDRLDSIAEEAVNIPSKARLDLPFKATAIRLEAVTEGSWGADLRATLLYAPSKSKQTALRYGVDDPSELFDLQIHLSVPGGSIETIRNLTFIPGHSRYVVDVLKRESQLVRWRDLPDIKPLQSALKDLPSDLDRAKGDFDDAGEALKQAVGQHTSTIPEIKAALADLANKRQVYHRTLPKDDLSLLDQLAQGAKEDLHLVLGATKLPASVHDGAVNDAKSTESKARQALAAATTNRAHQVTDGAPLNRASFFPTGGMGLKLGLYALESIDLFNLLCLPTRDDQLYQSLLPDALDYCVQRRALLIVDPPGKWQAAGRISLDLKNDPIGALSNDVNLSGAVARNAALFYPRLRSPNSLNNGTVEDFAPCGAVAGIFARTDAQRGVWKAPAGLDASLRGVQSLSVSLTDAENGLLNPVGINCLRAFPSVGRVIWGSRTLRGADQLSDDYKYVPVRRTALFIEESLYRGTQWAAFEPNDEPLWAQLRLNIGSFLHGLFRQGAFQGRSPAEAYFVKCDRETTTQSDINKGVVNVAVGFAPLKPIEFVVITLQQLAGQPDP